MYSMLLEQFCSDVDTDSYNQTEGNNEDIEIYVQVLDLLYCNTYALLHGYP